MYKSKFEAQIAPILTKYLGRSEIYEQKSFPYVLDCAYTPDWKVSDRIWVESKGLFSQEDRRKMKVVKRTYPEIVFILLFQNPHRKIAKNSKTTYSMWAEKNGFIWCDLNNLIPTITAVKLNESISR